MITRKRFMLMGFWGFLLIGGLLWSLPAVRSGLDWRYEVWRTYIKNSVDPAGPMPTPIPSTPFATFTVMPDTPQPIQTDVPTALPSPLAGQVLLPAPEYERQGINNCGPATLAMALRMYGWEGNQEDIARVIKPIDKDRNVNPDELRYYVLNEAGWLRAEYRVAGDMSVIKRLLSADFPVIIEEATAIDPQDANGPYDDRWAAHYVLINGYDDLTETVIVQDSQNGPNRKITYDKLLSDWKPFNYLYMIIFLPEDAQKLESILGEDWDIDQNRLKSLAATQDAAAANGDDAFAWFNLGSNLVYFERYAEAAQAFDRAFTIGLPQRMTRYQFFPFFAYYNTDRIDYLLELTKKTFEPINGSYAEEALLWHGYALLRQGDASGAVTDWYKALEVHPGYCDAERAIKNYIQPDYKLSSRCNS